MAQLGDLLVGAAGRPIDRIGLESAVMQGQAMAGLRSAQTEEALANAQEKREQQAARDRLGDSLYQMLAAQGDVHARTNAQAATDSMIAGYGDAKVAAAAQEQYQKNQAFATVADPTADPDKRMAAAQAMQPNEVPFQAVDGQLIPRMQPHSQTAPPTVYQTPASTATNYEHTAKGDLDEVQAKAGGFNPHSGSGANSIPVPAQGPIAELIRNNPNLAPNIRSLTSNGGWGVAYHLARPNGPLAGEQDPFAGAPGAPPAGGAPAAPVAAPGGAPPSAAPLGAPPAAPPAPPAATPANSPGAGGVNQPVLATGIAPAPGISLAEQASIRHYYASTTGMGRVMALGTMGNHANLFDAIADQLHNNQFTPSNYIKQAWAKTFGAEAPTDLRTVGSFLGREAIRATVNSGAGTGAERELQVTDSSSPQQLHGAATTLRQLGVGQYRNLDSGARRGGVDISQILDPEIRPVFTGAGGGAGTGGGAAVHITNDAEFDALPSNTLFIGPDGQQRRKP